MLKNHSGIILPQRTR